MTVTETPDCILLSGYGEMNLDLTLDCGQAFRWQRDEAGIWRGTAYGRSIGVRAVNDGIEFYGSNAEDIKNIWTEYFDLGRDYGSILNAFKSDPHLCSAIEKSGTVRILNQEPWETLCTFIISACNNIPRIKGIVARLCEGFGERLSDGSYTFPSAGVIASKTVEELAVLRAGYRAPFILDAAKKVSSGEIDLAAVKDLTEAEARAALMKINGVGRKVADCTLLFSLGFSSVFPVDRHIKRACEALYPGGIPECFSPFAGLAQQYIFIVQAEL